MRSAPEITTRTARRRAGATRDRTGRHRQACSEKTETTAAEPTVAPDPMAALDPADRPIAEKMRDLLAGKTDKIFTSKKERTARRRVLPEPQFRAALARQGRRRMHAPRRSIARMQAADADGLETSDYKAPTFAGLSGPDALAEAELKLTQTVLTYARHLQAGRFPYTRVSSNNIELPQ